MQEFVFAKNLTHFSVKCILLGIRTPGRFVSFYCLLFIFFFVIHGYNQIRNRESFALIFDALKMNDLGLVREDQRNIQILKIR